MTRPTIFRRLLLPAITAMATVPAVQAAPDSIVTINEIHYRPADAADPLSQESEWIELHNQMSIRVDLGGWTLRGEVDYTFPEGTVMEPGGYLVISQSPGTPAGSLGPWNGRLDNAGGEIRLHERWGRMMDVVDYDDNDPWPVAPDGSGPTLAKVHPDRLSDAAPNWAASAQTGGTPGAANFPTVAETGPRIVVEQGSVWKFTTSPPPEDWTVPGFDDGGWEEGAAPLASGGSGAATPLPAAQPVYRLRKTFAYSGGIGNLRVHVSGTLVGRASLFANGGTAREVEADGPFAVVLTPEEFAPGTCVLAVELQPADDAPVALDLAIALIDGATTVAPAGPPHTAGPVVINEIAYHLRPVYPDPVNGVAWQPNDGEWLELHNPGAEAVSLDGWRLSGGIDYAFPAGTSIAGGGFLVVSGGEFQGGLSNSSDTLRLRDATDAIVDEVTYFDGGRWPEPADGGGSTLELIDPSADNRRAESWAASDEGPRSGWQQVRYRATGAEPPRSNNPSNWREFLLGLLDAGEALIDDVSVVENPDGSPIQLIRNGTFDGDTPGGGAAHWRLMGTHRLSRVEANPDGPGNVLRLVATAELEHTYNNASTTFAGNRAISRTATYEISFRAKWLSGSPQLNSRLYLNRAARTTILAQPETAGTPGAPNSRRIPDAGPTFDALRHSPLVPAAREAVRVSVTASHPAGIRQMELRWAVNNGDWQSSLMGDDGTGNWFGIVPGQNTNAIVQFYVRAVAATGAEAVFPPAGPDSRALYRAGDNGISAQPVKNKMRLYMTSADASALHRASDGVSNYRWPCTVIYNDQDVWYDAGVRLRSSPYGRQSTRTGWNIRFGKDHLFRGVQNTVAIDGAFNMPRGDGGGWQENSLGACVTEMLYHAISRRAGGIPTNHDDIVYFQTPRSAEGNRRAQLKMTRFGSGYLEEEFRDGADGMLFKQELIYYPNNTVDGNPESPKQAYNAVLDTEIRNFGTSPDNYRFNFLPQNNLDRDDFSALIALGEVFDSPTNQLLAATSAVMDSGQWMRTYALTALTGLADTYNSGLAHNIELYVRPEDGKVLLFPWDQDHAFYYSPTSDIFGGGTHRLAAIIALPANRRMFASSLLDLCTTAFTNEHLDPIVDHLSQVAGKTQYAASLKSWISRRRSYVMSRLNSQFPETAFRIMSGNGGEDHSISTSHIELEGRGSIEVRGILLSRNGSSPAPAEVAWLDTQRWVIDVPLVVGANSLEVTAIGPAGTPVGTDSIVVTNTGIIESGTASNLAVSEINARPPVEGEQFLELVNRGTAPIDLTGVRFVNGVQFDFTGSSTVLLAPGSRVVVVSSRSAFEARYGTAVPVAGEWSPLTRLNDSGERLTLVDRAGRTIADFSWDNRPPWPDDRTGDFTLTLVRNDANPADPASWRPGRLPGGSPGTSDSLSPSAFPDTLAYALVDPPEPDADTIAWTERLGADDIRIVPEVSDNLARWLPDPGDGSLVVPVAESVSNGGKSLTVRLAPPFRYLRLRIAPR